MDDDLSLLEAELKRLRPAAPSRELHERIGADLARLSAGVPGGAVSRRIRWWWVCAGALPVAAALVVGLMIGSRRSAVPVPAVSVVAAAPSTVRSAPAITEMFKPVSAENVLYAVSDEGMVTLEDGTAARRERLNYVDTITWKNPRTNASVRWTLPREEVRVVPVRFQ
jgi:hypothetical protein